jgi:hypothetical protein
LTQLKQRTGLVMALAAAMVAVGLAQQQQTMTTTVTTTGGQGAQVAQEVLAGLPPGLLPDGGSAKAMEVGTGLILGRVVDPRDQSPIAGAIVTLSLSGFAPQRVQATSDGRFVFRALPKGNFSISTMRPGYADGAAGRLRPGGAPQTITLNADQRLGNVEIPMWRYASISGQVVDEHNDPMPGLTVRTLRREFVSGRRRLVQGPTDTTDDRGQYRISGLTPGDYLVVLPITQGSDSAGGMRLPAMPAGGGGGAMTVTAVAVRESVGGMAAPMALSFGPGNAPVAGTDDAGAPLVYQTEFHSAALAASRATALTIDAGEERNAIDFKLMPVRGLSISGVVTGPEGPTPNVQLQLLPADAEDLVSPFEVATAATDATGAFTFAKVPAGSYVLRAQLAAPGQMTFTQSDGNRTMIIRRGTELRMGAAPLPETPTLWAEMPVSLGTRNIDGVTIALREGLKVSGSLVFSGVAAQPTVEQRANIRVTLEAADGRTQMMMESARGRVGEDGSFTTMSVPAGKYVLRVIGALQGWTLRDATFNGRDITSVAADLRDEDANGVVVTFTDRPSEVSGTVRNSSGNPDQRAGVLLFPADPSLWTDTGAQPRRLRSARAGQDGTFRFQTMPPGDYYLIAVDDTQMASWQDPTRLAEFARAAQQVRLAPGDTRTQNLTTRGER